MAEADVRGYGVTAALAGCSSLRGLFAPLVATTIFTVGLIAASPQAAAQSAATFYRGRTITVYVGYGAGGGYDLFCRLFAQHFGRHLDDANVVTKNEPGAGSLKLANELFGVLPKDGTALGMFSEMLHLRQVLGDLGIKFVSRDFTWIGRLSDSDPVLVTASTSPVATMADAMKHEVVIGVPGAGSSTFLNLSIVNRLLGAKFKLVSGYEGSSQIRLALERGEVQGIGSTLWRVDKAWIRAQHMHVLYQTSLDPAPDLPGVPVLVDLGRNDGEKRSASFPPTRRSAARSSRRPTCRPIGSPSCERRSTR
jgi:tripartite-type tricarboxylate transporter receptor subunit TctC